MAAGPFVEDESRSSAETRRRRLWLLDCIGITLAIAIFSAFVLFICIAAPAHSGFLAPEFWVKVSGVEGLDRSAGAVTAPTFNITLRVNNEARSFPFCGKGGTVDVAYANVPLAHGEFSEFCVPTGVIGSVPVVATSEGLGLPDDLFERMESQRRRHQRVTLAVHVRAREVTGSLGSSVLWWCTGSTAWATTGAICLPDSCGTD
jgi:hypothetical protein